MKNVLRTLRRLALAATPKPVQCRVKENLIAREAKLLSPIGFQVAGPITRDELDLGAIAVQMQATPDQRPA